MSQIDKIKAQNHLTQLAMIDPYPEVIEALTEAVECFALTRKNSDSMPEMVIYGKELDEDDESDFIPSSLPWLYIQLLAPEPERFLMTIDLPGDDGNKAVKEHMEAFVSSVFSCSFKPRFYDNMHSLMVVFDADVLRLARLVTYFLQLMGFRNADDIKVNRSMDVSAGDMSLAVFPEDLSIPNSFIRAFAKLQEILDGELYDGGSCSMYLRLSALNAEPDGESMAIEVWEEDGCWWYCEQQSVGDREALDSRRAYGNFDCIRYYVDKMTYWELIAINDPEVMMKFMTDYFQFLYPNVRREDIVASIACVKESCDDISCVEFFFYPDGTEDPQEKYEELINFIRCLHASHDSQLLNLIF